MRNIEFRGKRTDGQWVYGYYFAKPILDKHFIECEENQWLVHVDTVGQYTGLRDKNGFKIYEGDVIRFNVYGIDCIIDVQYVEGFFGGRCKGVTLYLDVVVKEYNAEVIGNVYDDPELLRGAKNDE